MKFTEYVASIKASSASSAVRFAKSCGVALLLIVTALVCAPTTAMAAEHSLAGIRIFASSQEVLDKYGEPTKVLTGAAATGPSAGGPAAGSTSTAQATTNNAPPEFSTGAPMQMAPPAGGDTGSATSTDPTLQEAMFEYDRPNGLILQFLFSPDGRVIQISVLGYKGTVTTARNIGLGSTFGRVISKYGYPEGQDTSTTGVLMMKYLQKQHVAFQLHQGKVVGITVAAVE